MLWLSIFFGFFHKQNDILGGQVGYEINDYLQDYLGVIGAVFILTFLAIAYAVIRLKITPDKVGSFFKSTKDQLSDEFVETTIDASTESIEKSETAIVDQKLEEESVSVVEEITENLKEETTATKSTFEMNVENLQPTIGKKKNNDEVVIPPMEITTPEPEPELIITKEVTEEIDIEVKAPIEEKEIKKNLSDTLVEDFGEFDPTLELGHYKFPPIDLLKDYTKGHCKYKSYSWPYSYIV